MLTTDTLTVTAVEKELEDLERIYKSERRKFMAHVRGAKLLYGDGSDKYHEVVTFQSDHEARFRQCARHLRALLAVLKDEQSVETKPAEGLTTDH